jgi:transcriptional regulator with XRE-family HTH domain
MSLQGIGERVKELRQKLGLTQKQLSKELGITASALSSYEKGITTPSTTVIYDMAKYTKVSTDWLLGLSDKITTETDITTYADVIKSLDSLSRVKGLNTEVQIRKPEPNAPDAIASQYGGIIFCNSDNIYDSDFFEKFFEDWKKMKDLLSNKAIDIEVYDLWLEKTINKFKDVKIYDEGVPY